MLAWDLDQPFSKIAPSRNNEAVVLIIHSHQAKKAWNSSPIYLNGTSLRRIRIPSFAMSSIKKRQDLGLVPNPAEVRIHLYLCMTMLRIIECASWIMNICSVYVCLEEIWIPKPFLSYLYLFHNWIKNHWRKGVVFHWFFAGISSIRASKFIVIQWLLALSPTINWTCRF